MPSFADSIFLFVLALLLFGPKRLPVLARELGKWVGEFRRASNEFKMQMEDELRASEQADRQKQIAAMEAAAPVPPRLDEIEPEHPHMRHAAAPAESAEPSIMPPSAVEQPSGPAVVPEAFVDTPKPAETADGVRPIPIAVSGDLRMMPPATGLPTPRPLSVTAVEEANALGGLIDSIPNTTPGSAAHGD